MTTKLTFHDSESGEQAYRHAHALNAAYPAPPARHGAPRRLHEHDSATTRYEMRTIRLRFERDTTSYEELCAFEQ